MRDYRLEFQQRQNLRHLLRVLVYMLPFFYNVALEDAVPSALPIECRELLAVLRSPERLL
jgi:hypothetical protein